MFHSHQTWDQHVKQKGENLVMNPNDNKPLNNITVHVYNVLIKINICTMCV